ncbi:MAG TPA: potassium channel family protein [Actinomycetes bacterium]|nr:potassium channel family protein [Actinomycetes bacterium]
MPRQRGRVLTAPRRRVLASLLRSSLTSTVLVVLYYTLPLTGRLEASTTVWLLGGLLGFAAVITWQVRAILGSHYPALRAIEALAATIPLFLLAFAATYVKMADVQAGSFSEPLTRTDALYFTITVFSTVGFGDITPTTQAARVAVMVQMLGGLLLVGLVLRVVVDAVKTGRQRRDAASADITESSHRDDAASSSATYVAKQDGPGT